MARRFLHPESWFDENMARTLKKSKSIVPEEIAK